VILAAIAIPVTVAAVALTAQGAQASTPGCTNGALLGYCATQADSGSPVLDDLWPPAMEVQQL